MATGAKTKGAKRPPKKKPTPKPAEHTPGQTDEQAAAIDPSHAGQAWEKGKGITKGMSAGTSGE